MHITVVLLEQNKYFIHQDSVLVRDLSSLSNDWFDLYSPIRIIERVLGDNTVCDKLTKIYMQKYGIENVRGSEYSKVVLSEKQISFLKQELETKFNICTRCQSDQHFSYDCPYKIFCYRCGRYGHNSIDCYAVQHVKGFRLAPEINTIQKIRKTL